MTMVSRIVDTFLAPETVAIGQLTSPAPWGAVIAGLSALAVAGAYAALLALVRVRRVEVSALTAVAAYWMCAVVAGAAVAAVPVAATVVQAVVVERTVPWSFADTLLLSAAHWGLVWGWAPALLARALDGDTRPRSRLGLAGSAALVYAVAAVALVAAAPAADSARGAAVPSVPEPEPAPTGTPVPAVAPGEWQVDPRWCTSGQLELTAGPADAALGSRVMPVHAANVSDAACVLESYPDVAFSDPLTAALDVAVDHGGRMGSEERQMVQVDTDITGGTVSVTAWELRAD